MKISEVQYAKKLEADTMPKMNKFMKEETIIKDKEKIKKEGMQL